MDVNFSGSSFRPESEDVRSEASSDTWDPHEWASCVVTQSQEKANVYVYSNFKLEWFVNF